MLRRRIPLGSRWLGRERIRLHVQLGPFSAKIHDQSDNNSFTFIAGGVPLVLDAGSANRRTEGTPSSSLGHNYEYVVHVPVALGPAPRGTRFAIVGAAEGPVGHIEFLHPRTLTATSEPYHSRCDPYRRHDLWRFQTRASNPHFMVLLTSRDLQARPAVTFVLTDARAELRLSWPWGVDEIRFERSDQSEQQAASFTRAAGA